MNRNNVTIEKLVQTHNIKLLHNKVNKSVVGGQRKDGSRDRKQYHEEYDESSYERTYTYNNHPIKIDWEWATPPPSDPWE